MSAFLFLVQGYSADSRLCGWVESACEDLVHRGTAKPNLTIPQVTQLRVVHGSIHPDRCFRSPPPPLQPDRCCLCWSQSRQPLFCNIMNNINSQSDDRDTSLLVFPSPKDQDRRTSAQQPKKKKSLVVKAWISECGLQDSVFVHGIRIYYMCLYVFLIRWRLPKMIAWLLANCQVGEQTGSPGCPSRSSPSSPLHENRRVFWKRARAQGRLQNSAISCNISWELGATVCQQENFPIKRERGKIYTQVVRRFISLKPYISYNANYFHSEPRSSIQNAR